MNVYCIVMFEFNYSVGDIRNSDLGEGIICSGEGSGGKGGGKWRKGGREVGEKGEGSRGKGGGKWGMPTPLSTPSLMFHFIVWFHRILLAVDEQLFAEEFDTFTDRHSGSVVERPLCDREVAGSIPGRVIPKTLKKWY